MKNNHQMNNAPFVSRFYQNGILVTENVAAQNSLEFLYQTYLGKIIRRLLRRSWWSKLIGWYQDSRFSKRSIKPFIAKHKINMNDFICPPNGYQSFNDFFCRKLKPGTRVINHTPRTIISPADAKLLMFESITPTMKFFVKKLPFNLEQFLQSKELATTYAHGSMMILRLAPYDYHRYHFPFDCFAHKPHTIIGQYESVNPLAYVSGVQPLVGNQRAIIPLESPLFDTVLMIPVGAMCAGKIIHTFTPQTYQKKGDEAGYFAFGGSTIVMLFKQGCIQPLEPFINHSQKGFETAITMGQAIAQKK